jgi:signal transduction histidine kinase
MSLSTCKVIVDALGGEIDVDTQNGKTTATFWFPCKMRDRHKGV